MTTRISPDGPQTSIGVERTAHRTTPRPARPFNALLDHGASAVVAGAEAAASKLPGGPVVVAAVRDSHAEVGGAVPVGAGRGVGGTSATGAVTPSDQGLEGVLARQTEDSLYFLQLQQQIQQETRSYQAVSNVLKARHDSVKNAIGNLR